jgi:digeranylgeranylglycerophospholipid reductase
LKTLIIDRKNEVGVPIRCGEGVAEDVISDFGTPITKDCIRTTVNRAKLVSSSGRTFEITTKNKGVVLNRTIFEQHIIDTACSNGAKLVLNTNVTGLSKNGIKIGNKTVKSKLIVGADGIESLVGYWAGIDTTLTLRDIGICAQYVISNMEVEDNRVEMYWGEKFTMAGGYAWVFPKGGASANVGIGVTGVQVPKIGMRELLDRFIKIRCGGKYKKIDFQVGSIPQSIPIPTTVKNNVVLVGDAARLAIPLTGAGIGHALLSGKLAAKTIIEMEEKGAGLEYLMHYDRDWRPIIGPKLKRAYKLKEKFVNNPKSIDRVFTILRPLAALHKLFPNFIERVALRNFRY